jgi:hypothetical protein
MTNKASAAEMKAIFDPLVDKHFNAEDRAALQQRSFDQAEVSKTWETLIAEAKALMAKGDPSSAAAIDLARRWQAQVRMFTQGDPAMSQKAMSVWKDAMATPSGASQLPLNPEIFAFIGKAQAAAKAANAQYVRL